MWVTLNRVRTCQGRCNATLHKWNMVESTNCDCGALEQSIPHIVLFCHLRRFDGDFMELYQCSSTCSIDWLTNIDINL